MLLHISLLKFYRVSKTVNQFLFTLVALVVWLLLKELGGAVQGNRKFQTGKQAKQRAEALAIQKEFIRQEQLKQQERITSGDDSGEGAGAAGAAEGRDSAAPGTAGNTGVSQEVAMQQYELQRGPSLMDAHMQQRQGTEKQRAGQKRERQAFDREKVANLFLSIILDDI